MKRVISLVLVALIVFCMMSFTVFADNGGVKVKLDGEVKTLVAYNIKDNNYFKIRDVANLLKGTDAEFDVTWNESKRAIELYSNTPYSTDEELTSDMIVNPVAVSSYVPMYKDGAVILLGAYNIADNNYFKLRDIASAINFAVDWNEEEKIIEINTSKDYVYPESSSFGLNTKYLSFIGKTKGEVDKILGSSNYSWEFAMSTYDNDVMIGWGTVGEEPDDYSTAISMYIPLKELFYNCPETVSEEQIKSLFGSSQRYYNEMDEVNVLAVNYCGKSLEFTLDYGLTKDSFAFINIYNDYINPEAEYIQINNADSVVKEEKVDKFTGRYETTEWVEGSYIDIKPNGDAYDVEILLVRGANIETGKGRVEGNKMYITDDYNTFKNLVIEWIDDNNITIYSTDKIWNYMVSDKPVPFFKK